MRILFLHRFCEVLGIEYLSSSLKKAGHKTDLAFDPGLEGSFFFKKDMLKNFLQVEKKIKQKIKRFKPDIVTFYCPTNNFLWVKNQARMIKEEFGALTLVGGPHPTILPEYIVSDNNIDMVCRGEGEEAIVEIADSFDKGDVKKNIKNIWLKDKNKIIRNEMRLLNQDIDNLPFPDKDIFYKYGAFSSRLYMTTSRGCPFVCSYCHNKFEQELYKGQKFLRRRSVDNVIEELHQHLEKYKEIKSIQFYDDTFTLDKRWALEFCKRYEKEVGLKWFCMTRTNTLDAEILKAMKKANCDMIRIGIESGNPHIRNVILNRNLEQTDMIKKAKMIVEAGIRLNSGNIFGIPEETPKEMWDTAEANLQIKQDIFTSIFYPFPETWLANYAVEKGMLNEGTLENIKKGVGGMHQNSIIEHPYKEYAMNMKIVLPILGKFPFLKAYAKKHLKNRYSRLVRMLKPFSIYLMEPREAPQRLLEYVIMIKKFNRAIKEDN